MRSTDTNNRNISRVGLVHGWPEHSAPKLFDLAERGLGEHAVAIVLPEASCADIDCALAELVRVVLALYPAWLPEAEGIDTPAGAGAAAVADLARAAADKSSLFGPVLLRLARAALAKQTSVVLDDIPREIVALECGKLVRASYQIVDFVVIMPATAVTEVEIRASERTALWLADHVRCAVWIAGPAAARMPQIGVNPSPIVSLLASDGERAASLLPDPPWVTPLAGRPNPFSAVEQRL